MTEKEIKEELEKQEISINRLKLVVTELMGVIQRHNHYLNDEEIMKLYNFIDLLEE